MSIVAWGVLGLIAGFIGSKLVNKTGEGFILDIALGIVGAVVGGWLFSIFGMSGVTGLNIYSSPRGRRRCRCVPIGLPRDPACGVTRRQHTRRPRFHHRAGRLLQADQVIE